ncbi:MAG: SpvB/TcaC N-terminal domain-containing protein [Paludibacter sp.]|nr:SpvB/TcaC N-terminal domain-containing protein [Paludibacter sp.]
MRYKYTAILLLVCIGMLKAQYQNYDLNNPDNDSKTYIGRDYVRLKDGYSFSAANGGTMNAKISSGLTTAEAKTFLNIPATSTTNPDDLTAINTGYAVGQIPISSSVSPSGAKCYNVPIEIVPGRMGFQPNISLSYNSQAGNGVVGMGWNISGLSSIERVNKNMFFDGETETIKVSNEGAFALDGVNIIETGRTTEQINYETVQGNIKIIAYLAQNGLMNPKFISYFEVLYPNGNVGIFGSHNYLDYARLSFPISRLIDMNGNEISFLYTFDGVDLNNSPINLKSPQNVTYYISEINYGKCYNKPDFAKIKFAYEDDRPDQIFSLQSTKSCIYRKRLSKIESFANTDLIRTYQLAYSNTDNRTSSNESDVSRLVQINSFINEGNIITDNLNPLKFYYGDNDMPSIITTDTGIEIENFTSRKSILGKFCYDPNTYGLVSYSASAGYVKDANNQVNANPLTNIEVMIYQNIANPNFVRYAGYNTNSSPHSGYVSTGTGFLGALCLDFDGDGKGEIVRINSSGITNENELINLRVYNTDANYNISVDKNFTGLSFGTYHQTAFLWDYRSMIPKHFYTGNFTGNGRDEIICIPEKMKFHYNILIGDIDFGNSPTYIIQFNNQDEVNLQTLVSDLLTEEDDLIFTIDIDGDSQTELLHVSIDGTDIYKYKQGYGLNKISHWNITKQNFKDGRATFVDLNSDGKLDIVLAPDKPTKKEQNSFGAWIYNYYDNWSYYFTDGVDIIKTINKNQFSNENKKFIIQDVDEDNIPELLVIVDSAGDDNLQLYPFSFKDLCFVEAPFITTFQFKDRSGLIPVDVNTSVNSKELILLNSYYMYAKIVSVFKSNANNNQISLMINLTFASSITT